MNNPQPAEPIDHRCPSSLDVQSIFSTIQGEGPFAGTPAVFVRLAGCNIRCPGCDTDYTSKRQKMTIGSILQKVKEAFSQHSGISFGSALGITTSHVGAPKPLVVITGGEPFRQDFSSLVYELQHEGVAVQIESNGLVYLEGFPYNSVCLVVSPKTGTIDSRLWSHITALKYVVQEGKVDNEDGLPTRVLEGRSNVARPPQSFRGQIFIQPMDEQDEVKNKNNLSIAVGICLRYRYRLCIQSHKLCGLD